MPTYLIQITIGPVQEFIASARKLRDLWFGSHLLSELSKTVARKLHRENAKLIFPYLGSNDANQDNYLEEKLKKDSDLIVANKILAEIETDDPANVVATAKAAWSEHRREIGEAALKKIKSIPKIRINEKLYEKQMLDAGEFFGAWVEWNGNYAEAKAELDKVLAGRKNLREFDAPAWDGTGIPKSSLDGLREAVTGDNQEEIIGLIKENERLDALACIKRFYPLTGGQERKHFDDLSGIALLPWMEGMTQRGKTDLVLKFIRADKIRASLPRQRDVSAVTEDNVIQICRICPEYFFLEEKKLTELDAFSAFRDMEKAFREPHKYACILVGDGDHMGKTLEKIQSAEGHRTFSQHLGNFARDVGGIIGKHGGSLIYAGGDDVMAYIPLHHAIECAGEVRAAFSNTMDAIFADKSIDLPLDLLDERPTFSAGLAIVHQKSPLDQALNKARQAESMAKEQGGRDALAIIQSKRSGSDIIICDKWDDASSGKNSGILSRLNSMIRLCRSGKLPGTLPYQFRQAQLEGGDAIAFEMPDLTTAQNGGASLPKPKNAASALVLRLLEHKEYAEDLRQILLDQTSIRKLADEIVIARQIATAQTISKGGKDVDKVQTDNQ